jgi:hypothetical protein
MLRPWLAAALALALAAPARADDLSDLLDKMMAAKDKGAFDAVAADVLSSANRLPDRANPGGGASPLALARLPPGPVKGGRRVLADAELVWQSDAGDGRREAFFGTRAAVVLHCLADGREAERLSGIERGKRVRVGGTLLAVSKEGRKSMAFLKGCSVAAR